MNGTTASSLQLWQLKSWHSLDYLSNGRKKARDLRADLA
jgi:hypothetical protein